MRVGVLGLGNMGAAMARNLMRAGFEVLVFNRSAEKAEPLVNEGARLARTPAEAEAAKLFVVAAGESKHIEKCRPVFDAIGQRTFVVGERPEQANVIKLCGNFMIAAAIEVLAEAMTMARKNDIDS